MEKPIRRLEVTSKTDALRAGVVFCDEVVSVANSHVTVKLRGEVIAIIYTDRNIIELKTLEGEKVPNV